MQEKAHAGDLAMVLLRKQAFTVPWLESWDPAAYRRAFHTPTAEKVANVDVVERPGRLLAAHDVKATLREGGALVVGSGTAKLSEVFRRAGDLFEC